MQNLRKAAKKSLAHKLVCSSSTRDDVFGEKKTFRGARLVCAMTPGKVCQRNATFRGPHSLLPGDAANPRQPPAPGAGRAREGAGVDTAACPAATQLDLPQGRSPLCQRLTTGRWSRKDSLFSPAYPVPSRSLISFSSCPRGSGRSLCGSL